VKDLPKDHTWRLHFLSFGVCLSVCLDLYARLGVQFMCMDTGICGISIYLSEAKLQRSLGIRTIAQAVAFSVHVHTYRWM